MLGRHPANDLVTPTLAGQYVDFQRAADEALEFAVQSSGVAPLLADKWTAGSRRVAGRAAGARDPAYGGLRPALLSNATDRMLTAGIARSGLDALFEHVLSSDRVRSFKADPRVMAAARSVSPPFPIPLGTR